MGRQARIDYPGAYHHIISRGFKRERIFEDEEDYKYYLECLTEFTEYEYKILEYALMPNHIHLLMQTAEIPLQKILKSINTRFAMYKVRKRGLPGPVFQGRPKSILITGEEHLKTVGRYILRNPKKAGLTEKLNYKWSSYKLLTKVKTPEWYDNSVILSEFNKNKIKAIEEYKKFISQPLKSDDKEYPIEKFSGIAAGNKILFENILKKVNKNKRKNNEKYIRKIDWQKRIKNILKENKLTLEKIKNENTTEILEVKQKIAYILKKICHLETKIIMKYLSISQPTLSRYVKKIKTEIANGKIKKGNL
jgi:REP element-mobilizing transposase RayT